MNSVKPGRVPSVMGGMMGLFAVAFGIFWTVMASNIGAPFWFFGIFFVLIGIVSTAVNFRNAFSRNRHSVFDITDSDEEPDPFSMRLGFEGSSEDCTKSNGFCPYCGARTDKDCIFCKKCGSKL